MLALYVKVFPLLPQATHPYSYPRQTAYLTDVSNYNKKEKQDLHHKATIFFFHFLQ